MTLTKNQVEALQKIKAVLSHQTARLLREYPGCTPTGYVYQATLVAIHKMNRKTLSELVEKGYLEERSSDGFGPEVRPMGG